MRHTHAPPRDAPAGGTTRAPNTAGTPPTAPCAHPTSSMTCWPQPERVSAVTVSRQPTEDTRIGHAAYLRAPPRDAPAGGTTRAPKTAGTSPTAPCAHPTSSTTCWPRPVRVSAAPVSRRLTEDGISGRVAHEHDAHRGTSQAAKARLLLPFALEQYIAEPAGVPGGAPRRVTCNDRDSRCRCGALIFSTLGEGPLRSCTPTW